MHFCAEEKSMDNIIGINSKADFQAVVAEIQSRKDYIPPQAFAIGLAHIGRSGNTLSVRFPHVNCDENPGSAAIFYEVASGDFGENISYASLDSDQMDLLAIAFAPFDDGGNHPNIDAIKAVSTMFRSIVPFDGHVEPVLVFIRNLQNPPVSAADAYLRLHLLSHCKIQPNVEMFNGVFGQLTNCAWTREEGPVEASHFAKLNMEYMAVNGVPLTVDSVDRFPRMTDFVVPSSVRIADANQVRLGAHLSPGTTVMQYGFVNANAGTLGASMVKGNIPMGVTVGAGTDVGAGSGFLGTLSGGNKIQTGAGKNCLIGTRAECGIMLGDNVCISLGVCFTGNTPVKVLEWATDTEGKFLTDRDDKIIILSEKVMKAKELTGVSDITFRRNSLNGCIEVIPVPNGAELNDMLHKN